MYSTKEFAMTADDFLYISKTVYKECGIVLNEQKRDMVYSRLARRIRVLNLMDFSEYIQYLQQNRELEFTEFINAITTNLTSFFREPHHFEFLEKTIIPEVIRIHRQDKRVRVWSAGCSSGMEPYSIAMTLHKRLPENYDVKILATDLDTNVLAVARQGVYDGQNVSGIDDAKLSKHFQRDPANDRYRIKNDIRQMITFKQLNLLEGWPMKGQMDVIFCRNVVIYFDQETKMDLFERFSEYLKPNGYLILGHSETMSRDIRCFKPLGNTIYQKV